MVSTSHNTAQTLKKKHEASSAMERYLFICTENLLLSSPLDSEDL